MGDWKLITATTSPRAAKWQVSGVYFFYVPDRFTPEPHPSYRESAVTILIWTHPFLRQQQLPDCFEQYRINGCRLTDDARAYRQVEAVLIHHREIASGAADLPSEPRPSAQKWIWMNYESPTHTNGMWRVEGAFNLTMSYRTDSDIFLPYGYLVPLERRARGAQTLPISRLSQSAPSRHRFVAWVISNWSDTHARVAFYYQLRRYIRIDVFGRAGWPLPEGMDNVVRLLGKYKFYLALENSQHTDYITEKLWNAVKAGTVPVVMGPPRRNYERFLPPEAFIHADDFPSMKKLARYLLELQRDPARIRRHLDWRERYGLHQPAFWDEHYCTACRAVKRARGKTDVVHDLTRWFQS
ncbi:alpha-(1,3)-fucosyltransferase 4-like [Xenentodon cancila]